MNKRYNPASYDNKMNKHLMRAMIKHDRCLEWILNHPQIINVPEPLFIGRNVRFYDKDRLVTETDIIAYDGSLHLVEYKLSYNSVRATEQLNLAAHYARHRYKGTIIKKYLYGEKFQLMEIK